LYGFSAIINRMSIDAHDKRKIRCRMLGHEVDFSYCRQVGGELPCKKIPDCWFERFDVEQFLQQHYTPDQIRQILTLPKPKLTSIVELIRQAQNNNDTQKSE